MATFSSVTRQHILQAIAEHDARGVEDFLGVYGFGSSGDHWLVHEGRRYDPTAILGVAHRYATGRLATADEFHEGMSSALAVLRRRGFEVTEPAGAALVAVAAPTARRTTSRPTRRSSGTRARPAEERPPAVCPTCFTALPATGVCDFCG